MSEGKKEFVKCELIVNGDSFGSFIEEIKQVETFITTELLELAVGDCFTFTKVEMTQEEFDSLPEFQGF